MCAATPLELDNGTIRVALEVADDGAAVIAQGAWDDTQQPFFTDAGAPLTAWFPKDLLPDAPPGDVAWRRVERAHFLRAERSLPLAGGLGATWVVELAERGSLFRAHVRLENQGDQPVAVAWFPVWVGRWRVPGGRAVRGWESLSFRAIEIPLEPGAAAVWGSRVHSSDRPEGGMNPYWEVCGRQGRVYFSLDWCGGWQAGLAGNEGGFAFDVRLPPEETQLTLAPGEAIAGPVMTVTAVAETDEARARAVWMAQRQDFARTLYGGPPPSYPFTYNHWYATRFDVDAAFLERQVDAMGPYGFDAFIVDAGWYEAVGKWTPHPQKFAPGAFEALLESVESKGVMPGIWSCPQFVTADKDHLPPEVDVPGMYRPFIDGYLLDYTAVDFTQFLLDHVALLRDRYRARWWKYDQDFFTEETRAGRMKNVVAFQDALCAVRRAHPDLIMENCQSGGRMINELTVLATQSQWLRDGGDTGLGHARGNISVALRAMDFLFPWAANRWTNNFDRNDAGDDEFTRYYCRSAMAGTWGLVADLGQIKARQRNVILAEVGNYRRLNTLKPDNRYDLILPEDQDPVVGVTFYTASGLAAGALLMRWDAQGPFDYVLPLPGLSEEAAYRVEDVDTGHTAALSGARLRRDGLPVSFSAGRQSALIFLDAAAS